MDMKIISAFLVSLVLVACSSEVAHPPPAQPAPTVEPSHDVEPAAPIVEPPSASHVADEPAPACVSTRFYSGHNDIGWGYFVEDLVTHRTWQSSDLAYFDGEGTTPNDLCPPNMRGDWRAATTAEVLALTQALPGCPLPAAFHAVYAWAPNAKTKPITTADGGCVDVATGTMLADCSFELGISRSTMCLR